MDNCRGMRDGIRFRRRRGGRGNEGKEGKDMRTRTKKETWGGKRGVR